MIKYIKQDLKLLLTYWHQALQILTVMMLVLILALGIAYYNHQQRNNAESLATIQTVALNVQKLAEEQKQTVDVATKDRNVQLQTISNELSCIGHFFAQPDWQTLSIKQLDACTLLPVSSLGGATGVTKSA